MKTIISVDHKTALLAGLDNQGEYTIEFTPADLTEAQRAELALSDQRAGAFLANNKLFLHNSQYDDMLPRVAAADLEALRAILDARILARAKRAADQRAEDQRLVQRDIHDKSDDDLIQMRNNGMAIAYWAEQALPAARRLGDQAAIDRIDRIRRELLPQRQAELTAKRAAQEEARQRTLAKREEEKAAAAKRRADQIAAWVAEHGTDNQRGRLAAGVLPEAEVLTGLRAQVFGPLEGEPRYVKLKSSDVCQCRSTDWDDDDSPVDFSADDATELTAAEWDRLSDLRRRMPEATITVRRHLGECEVCDEHTERTSYHVSMQVGEFKLTREYGEPESSPE